MIANDVMLRERAACSDHQRSGYEPDCVICTRRYFMALIDEEYVARWRYEALEREARAAKALAASYQKQVEELEGMLP